MKTETTKIERPKRDIIVGVRFSAVEIDRFQYTAKHIAIPFEIDNSKLVRTFALVGLQAFEYKQQRKKAQKKHDN